MRCAILVLVLAAAGMAHAADAPALELTQTIPLPNVGGRIDHFAVDIKGNRLFMAALGNNTVEVIDLAKGERVHTIRGLEEPQGIAYLTDANQIAVANGGDGSCRIYDGATYALVKTINLKSDADNARYDAGAKKLYVGFGNGALAFIDVSTQSTAAEPKLSGHPESFQLEQKGPRIFVNVPQTKRIEVIDREKKAVVAAWPMTMAHSNFPMTLDETHHRLFTGCRAPAKIVVFDTESGRETASFPCVGDTDDIFYDEANKRLYAIGGEGKINIFSQTDADNYKLESEIKTRSGARTGLFVSELKMLFVAAPHKGNDAAAILCYQFK